MISRIKTVVIAVLVILLALSLTMRTPRASGIPTPSPSPFACPTVLDPDMLATAVFQKLKDTKLPQATANAVVQRLESSTIVAEGEIIPSTSPGSPQLSPADPGALGAQVQRRAKDGWRFVGVIPAGYAVNGAHYTRYLAIYERTSVNASNAVKSFSQPFNP